MTRAYAVVDVFSDRPLMGNPVAVVLDAEGLDDTAMQAIARWTNLSETTFVVQPTRAGADYGLRIFTPGGELPFAGHPTLGSAHAVLAAGRATASASGALIQDCGVGLVRVEVGGTSEARRMALTLPAWRATAFGDDDVAVLEAVLGQGVVREAAPAAMDVGIVWAVAQVDSVDALMALEPDMARSADFERRLGLTGLTVFAVEPGGRDIELRSFTGSCGIGEDPVCGSGNGAVAAFRVSNGQMPATDWAYGARQGRCVGRDGRIALSGDADGAIRVAGACVTTATGMLRV